MTSRDVTYINSRNRVVETERPLGSVVNEAKDEVKEFAQTRIAMLISELRENLQTVKAALPMMVVGAAVLWMAFWVFTAAAIAIIWVAFEPSAYAPFIACIIVGVFYLIVGGALASLGYSNIKDKPMVPKRTIQVLKEDKIWFQNEARTQL